MTTLEDLKSGASTEGQVLFARDPLDPKLLTVDSLVRARLFALLKSSPNHLHRTENLLLAIVSLIKSDYFLAHVTIYRFELGVR
jgi:hypothetical protein